MPGAHNAVDVCLAIQPHERVALIADEASAPVAAALQRALLDRGVEPDCVAIERVASRPIRTAPREVLDALERADAGILCIQPRQGELSARMEIVSLVERRGMRYAHMVGVTSQIMRQGMRADYKLVESVREAAGGAAALISGRTLSVIDELFHPLRKSAAGLHGIQARLRPPKPYEGNAYEDGALPQVPKTLREAIAELERSKVARTAFGERVVEHYAHAARLEQQAFDQAVTDWELMRYFERI